MISKSFWLCRFVKLPFGCINKCLNRFLIVKFAKVHVQALHLHTQLHSAALLETEINCYNFPPSPASAKCCEAPQTAASVGSIRTLKRTQSLTIQSPAAAQVAAEDGPQLGAATPLSSRLCLTILTSMQNNFAQYS